MTMAEEVRTLAYYAGCAYKEGVAKDVLMASDYHDLIPERINLRDANILWQQVRQFLGVAEELVPLDDVELSQADWNDIVEQIYAGEVFTKVRLTPAQEPLPPVVHELYFPKYLATIPKDTRTPVAVSATIARLEEVIESHACTSPRANGLVVGRVQSGKTRNYIGLMLKAADEGWNVIIVLTSAIRSLALQTRNRIADEIVNIGANNRQYIHELDFLSSNPANTRAGDELNGDFLYWGVSMKQVDGLERIKNWFNAPGQPLKSMRVLIIDDEADNATPDSNARGENNLDEEEIDERIESIRTAPGFEELAEWFHSLREKEWPEIGAKTPAADTFEKLNRLLTGNKSKKTKRDEIVNSATYRRFLGMDMFADPPVDNLIREYFKKATGRGDDACGEFILLLKSILDIARDRSAINSAVCSLIGENPDTGMYAYPFSRCAYLGYTATPYANILNESPNHSPIYADFIQSLEISPQYFGVEAIFGCDIENVEPRMPIVQPITEEEQDKILAPLRRQGVIDVDENLVCKIDEEEVEWKSLADAIAWGFCTAALRRFVRSKIADGKVREKRDNRWTTVIVNVDHLRSIHGFIKEKLKKFVEARCGDAGARETFMDRCKEVWNSQAAQLTIEDFNRIFNSEEEPSRNYGDGVADYPSWDEIEADLRYFVEGHKQYVHTVEINSTPKGKEEQALYNQDAEDLSAHKVKELTGDHLWIVSGGNTIGRGLTLPGLTVSYFDRVRSSTCVDTLTQMGRWFGYRPGYELLPRVWMNCSAVGEMKRIAVLERRLHESIAYNFANRHSPRDPAHFQHIDCWGRSLSSRARDTKVLDAQIGTIAVTNDFYTSVDVRRRVYDVCEAFIKDLGPQKERSRSEYLYSTTPLWEKIDRTVVCSLLEKLLPCYPEAARKILRGIIREINGNEPVEWDVVLGNPKKKEGGMFGGHQIHYGEPKSVPVCQGAIHTQMAFLDMAFYAMIRSKHLWKEDLLLLDKYKVRVAEAIEQKRRLNNYVLPNQYEEALPGNAEDSILDRLTGLIKDFNDDSEKALPEVIHARLGDIGISQSYRRRTAADYMANVHASAAHERPTLQLYLFRPEGKDDGGRPMVSISFYWPGHAPDGFYTVSVDENPDFVRMVTPRVFCQNVEDILREHDFPMQRKELLCKMVERLGLRCNETFFDQNIKNPLAGFKYHRMEGHNAYCIDGWAEDEEVRLGNELVRASILILQRENRAIATKELIEMVINEQPRFRDFFSPKDADASKLNALMTSEVLDANDITVVSHRPKTYRYHN